MSTQRTIIACIRPRSATLLVAGIALILGAMLAVTPAVAQFGCPDTEEVCADPAECALTEFNSENQFRIALADAVFDGLVGDAERLQRLASDAVPRLTPSHGGVNVDSEVSQIFYGLRTHPARPVRQRLNVRVRAEDKTPCVHSVFLDEEVRE